MNGTSKPSVSRPLAQVFLLPAMIRAARECGYALAIHGSLDRDFDLVAIPWAENAANADALVERIYQSAGAVHLNRSEMKLHHHPSQKPHGRMSWFVTLGADWVIDLSVMPKQEAREK